MPRSICRCKAARAVAETREIATEHSGQAQPRVLAMASSLSPLGRRSRRSPGCCTSPTCLSWSGDETAAGAPR